MLITDIRLGPYNGLQLVVRARLANPSLPVLVVTAFHDPVLQAETERLSAIYLRKPVDAASGARGHRRRRSDRRSRNPAARHAVQARPRRCDPDRQRTEMNIDIDRLRASNDARRERPGGGRREPGRRRGAAARARRRPGGAAPADGRSRGSAWPRPSGGRISMPPASIGRTSPKPCCSGSPTCRPTCSATTRSSTRSWCCPRRWKTWCGNARTAPAPMPGRLLERAREGMVRPVRQGSRRVARHPRVALADCDGPCRDGPRPRMQ